MNAEFYISMGVDSSNCLLWYAKDQVNTYLQHGEYKEFPAFKPISTREIKKAMVLSKSKAKKLVTGTNEKWLAYPKIYIDKKVIDVVNARSVMVGNALSWRRYELKHRHTIKKS